MRRNTVGGRAFRSPLNPGWVAGQGMRGGGSSLYSAMPAMSKLGDSLIDKLSSEGLSKAGEAAGGWLGGLGSDALSNLASGLSGAATGATAAAGGGALGAIPVAGPFLAAAAEAAAPVLGFGSTVASKAAGLPLQAAGAAIGKAGAPIMAKMLGRAGMGAAAEGLHGPGTLLSGGGEPGDLPMKQAAMFGSMPKFDLGSGDGRIPPPQAPLVKPLGDEAFPEEKMVPLGDDAFPPESPMAMQAGKPPDLIDDTRALERPGKWGGDGGIDGVLGKAAQTDGKFKRPGTTIPPPVAPIVPSELPRTKKVGALLDAARHGGGPLMEWPQPGSVSVGMDAEPITFESPKRGSFDVVMEPEDVIVPKAQRVAPRAPPMARGKPLDQFMAGTSRTIDDLLAGDKVPGRARRSPPSRIR